MPEQLGFNLVHQVLATSCLLVRESGRFFRPLGLTEAQFNVLNILADFPDGMSQRELSDALVVDRSNVTTLLDRMEKAGWVRREDHPRDRRIHRVMLTAEGQQLWARVHPLYLHAVGQVTRGLGAGRMSECIETLRSLEDAVKNWERK